MHSLPNCIHSISAKTLSSLSTSSGFYTYLFKGEVNFVTSQVSFKEAASGRGRDEERTGESRHTGQSAPEDAERMPPTSPGASSYGSFFFYLPVSVKTSLVSIT